MPSYVGSIRRFSENNHVTVLWRKIPFPPCRGNSTWHLSSDIRQWIKTVLRQDALIVYLWTIVFVGSLRRKYIVVCEVDTYQQTQCLYCDDSMWLSISNSCGGSPSSTTVLQKRGHYGTKYTLKVSFWLSCWSSVSRLRHRHNVYKGRLPPTSRVAEPSSQSSHILHFNTVLVEG